MKTLRIRKNSISRMNIEPSYGCGIAHCTWRTFETKYCTLNLEAFARLLTLQVILSVYDTKCFIILDH